jgi:hypothetical protein
MPIVFHVGDRLHSTTSDSIEIPKKIIETYNYKKVSIHNTKIICVEI